MYKIYIRQGQRPDWYYQDVEYLVGTTTDRTLVDSGEGTYVWD
jgi:hypothetical protein